MSLWPIGYIDILSHRVRVFVNSVESDYIFNMNAWVQAQYFMVTKWSNDIHVHTLPSLFQQIRGAVVSANVMNPSYICLSPDSRGI